jgi:outer membrane protein assembly factor BamE (lipoprotein component of BamABCDE complex)
MVGMTREQAIVAIGYPLTSENGPLESSTWKMWRSTHGEYDLNFGPDGRLTSITGDDEAVGQMVYKPAP